MMGNEKQGRIISRESTSRAYRLTRGVIIGDLDAKIMRVHGLDSPQIRMMESERCLTEAADLFSR